MAPLPFRRVLRTAPLLLAALLALPALADITLGGNARPVAMGGAGLASGDSPNTTVMNPAFLAETGMRFGFQMPTIDAHMRGASYSDAFDLLGKPSLGAADALNLAVSLGDSETELGASASMGVLLPQLDVLASADIRADIRPNTAFQEWAKTGGSAATLGNFTGAKADVYAGGTLNLPSVGLGFHLPVDETRVGRVAVGVRVKPTQVYYSHYVIDGDAVVAGRPQLAPEMGGRDHLKQGSISADLGVMYTPASLPDARLALVVNNAIEPKAIDFGAAAPVGMGSKQLAPRSISIGTAIVKPRVTLAADLVDVTGAYGNAQLRLGGELRLLSGLALRGGYNTASGLTAGIGYGGFGIAYSKDTPIVLSQSIAF